jgi:membrane protein
MKNRHNVATPTAIRLQDWWSILVRVFNRAMNDNIGLLSAGIAFYAFLSIFPAIAAALMVWGLFTDVTALSAQLQALREMAPDAFGLVADQMVTISTQDEGGLTVGLIVSIVLAFWSASGGVAALMQAMNMAYHETETRGFIQLNVLKLGFTVVGILFVGLSVAAIAAVPPILKSLYLGALVEALANLVRWLVIIAAFMAACAMIYRIAPSRAHARWRWIVPGAVAAGLIWLVASIAFSAYLENFDAYNATFGSLGAVAALLMWFWISAYAICLGAELNAQLELFTTVDTTIDEPTPRGRRGAYVADHVEAPDVEPPPTPDANLNSQQAGERTSPLKASDSTII